MTDLLARQGAYRNFVGDFTAGQDLLLTEDGLAYVGMLSEDSVNLAIVGLNSAWLCGSDGESTSLIIGERQLVNALSMVRDRNPHLVLAMAHHPIDWLRDWDQQSCRDRLYNAAHLFHRGHMHDPDVTTSPHRQCIVVAAGSAYAGRFFKNSYNFVSVNLATGLAKIETFDYLPDQRHFTPREAISTPCKLGGDLEVTASELSAALSTVLPPNAPTGNFLAALILRQKDEIPIQLVDKIEFVSSDTAMSADPDQSAVAGRFLALRHLLRVRRGEESILDQIARYSDVIVAYSSELTAYCDKDSDCHHRITGAPLLESTQRSSGTTRPQTIALLGQLSDSQDWAGLEAQAVRHIADPDQVLAKFAKTQLAQALMHSDETPKRHEAANLAEQLVAMDDATVQDYLLAAGASEAAGFTPRSIELTTQALGNWSTDPYLRDYARGLATRTGDADLRSIVEAQAEVAGQ